MKVRAMVGVRLQYIRGQSTYEVIAFHMRKSQGTIKPAIGILICVFNKKRVEIPHVRCVYSRRKSKSARILRGKTRRKSRGKQRIPGGPKMLSFFGSSRHLLVGAGLYGTLRSTGSSVPQENGVSYSLWMPID